jgi:hypothetical protein
MEKTKTTESRTADARSQWKHLLRGEESGIRKKAKFWAALLLEHWAKPLEF